jgi:hypothetical protein
VQFNVHEHDGVVIGTEIVETGSLSEAPTLSRPSLADATFLELFRAISKDEPPAELVEMHRAEARISGRDPELVRAVTFDRSVLKTSFGTTSCTNILLASYDSHPVIQNNLNLSVLSFADVWSYNILTNAAGPGIADFYQGGVCADSSSASVQSKYTAREIGESSWTTFNGEVFSVPGGTWLRYTSSPSNGYQRRVRIGGSGTDFHLRTGHGAAYVQ